MRTSVNIYLIPCIIVLLINSSQVTVSIRSLPTASEGNVFTGVCQSFCSQLTSWLLGHCSSFLQCGRYASYWNAPLLPPANEVFTGVYLSTGGVSDSVGMPALVGGCPGVGRHTPWTDTPWADTPRQRHLPGRDTPPFCRYSLGSIC